MGVSNVNFQYFVRAGVDLEDTTKGTGDIYKAVNATVDSAELAGTSLAADGIICQAAKAGQSVSYTFLGVEKFTAGAAVTDGAFLKVSSFGYVTVAASGDYSVGKAIGAVTSGSIGTGNFNFLSPYQLTA